MLCPQCQTENPIGTPYCAGCGAKLELTDARARLEAVAEARRDNWRKVCLALNRALFLFFLVFIGSFLFDAYATRRVTDDFSAGAPLPPPPPLALSAAFIEQPELGIPPVAVAAPIRPEKQSEAEILADMAEAAQKLARTVFLKSGGAVKGVLLSHTKDEVRVIIDWENPPKVRAIKIGDIDFVRTHLPE